MRECAKMVKCMNVTTIILRVRMVRDKKILKKIFRMRYAARWGIYSVLWDGRSWERIIVFRCDDE